jgi:hypothetical protein
MDQPGEGKKTAQPGQGRPLGFLTCKGLIRRSCVLTAFQGREMPDFYALLLAFLQRKTRGIKQGFQEVFGHCAGSGPDTA